MDNTEPAPRAVVVHVEWRTRNRAVGDPGEFLELAHAAGIVCAAAVSAPCKTPDPRTFIGRGKVAEIHGVVQENHAELVLIDVALSPIQERNLDRDFGCRVLDRTGLILAIFAQRARSFEGKLQVELAQLRYQSTRLVRGWTHLERQKGGIGLRGGPGEKQLESDRRLIKGRIKQIKTRLDAVLGQREQQRRARKKASLSAVSMVGYTNAGKSTLFNCLTGADNYCADQLFATLDPTLRRLEVPGYGSVILGDTVGFIRHLPHDLVAAFRATLEEINKADLLLHVIDVSAPDKDTHIADAEQVIEEIGASTVPVIRIYNKIDCLPQAELQGEPRIQYDDAGKIRAVWVSATTGAGIADLIEALASRLNDGMAPFTITIPSAAGRMRARLHAQGVVLRETPDAAGGWRMTVAMSPARLQVLWEADGLHGRTLLGSRSGHGALKSAVSCGNEAGTV